MYAAMKDDVQFIVRRAIHDVLPDKAVQRALEGRVFPPGRVFLIAVGKAAWQMAKAATACVGQLAGGVVVTKYQHAGGPLPGCEIYEAGHPVPDENSFRAAQAVWELTDHLAEQDTILFLLSGGGSALFELPLIPPEELQDITQQLLSCGADIVEINTIRKRLSAVKGGRFAAHCAPARIFSVVLSDILGDPLDMIASGPAYPDSSTCQQAAAIVEKYHLRLSPEARACLTVETPKDLSHVETHITGSVRNLCYAAAEACRELGYEPIVLTDCLHNQAREAGAFLGSIARSHSQSTSSLAFIAGGETIVYLTGKGKGGRNQELALAAAEEISGLGNVTIFSVGSDGTDGPTDAAGGVVNGDTVRILAEKSITVSEVLHQNDAYHALQQADGLLITGPTGTNVNDCSIVLIRGVEGISQ